MSDAKPVLVGIQRESDLGRFHVYRDTTTGPVVLAFKGKVTVLPPEFFIRYKPEEFIPINPMIP